MRIDRLILREIRMNLLTPFETSFARTTERRILLVELVAGGSSAWGEVTAREDPFYSAETIETAWHILRDFVAPMLRGREVAPAALADVLAPIRGHEMAKAGVETALWALEAEAKGMPLAQLLGGTHAEIPCGVSIGLQPSMDALLSKIEKELADGYQRIKIKIKPGQDVALVEAVRKRFPQIRLMVDANAAYRLEDRSTLERLDDFYLMMIEQPLGPDEILEHARLQAVLKTPICLDESIVSLHDARVAIELSACRIVNIKLGRVGGHRRAREIHDFCQERSVPVWCGGMLESGVGRAHNIALSSLANFLLPGDVSASRRYWSEDIIEPAVEVSPQGTIRVPTAPGLGFEVKRALVETLTVRREELRL